MEYILLALLGLLPFGLYRWFRSEEEASDSHTAYWEDDSTRENEDITGYSRTDDDYYHYSSLSDSSDEDDDYYYHSSTLDTENDTDPLTDPSYCFMEGNIYHDMCHDDDWDDWNTWDDDWNTWDDDW